MKFRLDVHSPVATIQSMTSTQRSDLLRPTGLYATPLLHEKVTSSSVIAQSCHSDYSTIDAFRFHKGSVTPSGARGIDPEIFRRRRQLLSRPPTTGPVCTRMI